MHLSRAAREAWEGMGADRVVSNELALPGAQARFSPSD